jgi:hypothetical protein
MNDNDLIQFSREDKKQTHTLKACFKHAAKLSGLKWIPMTPVGPGETTCLICKEGFKRAVKYAETGWYE